MPRVLFRCIERVCMMLMAWRRFLHMQGFFFLLKQKVASVIKDGLKKKKSNKNHKRVFAFVVLKTFFQISS